MSTPTTMSPTPRVRSFLADDDLTSAEQREVLELAAALKADRHAEQPFAGPRSVAIIFDKPTLRTQVSFTTGVAELGGYPLMVDGNLAKIGTRESVADVARVLGRQVAAIIWRTFHQSDLEGMAAWSGVPVVNALTDDYHPCQVLADLLTIAEHAGGFSASGPALAGRTLAYVGDGSNNMAHSYLLGAALAGMDVHVGCPPQFGPRADVLARAQVIAAETGAHVSVHDDPRLAVVGADAVATDTWVSMGQEGDADKREEVFVPYQLDADLLDLADPSAVVLHCLPAYRGKEITSEVLDGPRAVVWDQAENRLHAQKAILTFLARAGERT
ncbi:MAG: ornithine carbamoyltransferase [Micrococcales bacterium 73-15]|uniref:ornithine carbamoyltransferase n=1 Tax=Salana multivorans TaxID=120377 RepID=UPI000969FB84|nr:ornithine carbamoyltransferase [Salana multivorans]OJX95569.1 MAG: ornithine carbamoyltransferase [Micrococcales bacterium 73-15]